MPGEQAVAWTPELEVQLFHSMYGHKPVGELTICKRFEAAPKPQICTFIISEIYNSNYSVRVYISTRQYRTLISLLKRQVKYSL